MNKRIVVPAMVLACTLSSPINIRVDAQTTVRRTPSGFNVFSVQQDVDIGRQSAAEVEKQVQLLDDASVNRYLNQIIQRLAVHAPGADYPYQIKAVNATEINAFALPGGPMYVNRGLIAAARSEAELAGVLAHEMSHVALRHGTNQASKAYLAQAGLGILGGLLGSRSTTAKIVNAVGGFGLNAAFLKFSRDDEYEADASGADIMAKAGYNPNAMADFFAYLRQEQGRNPGKLERFFSSHPAPANREARIRQLASSLGPVQNREVGGLASIQTRLGSTAAATSTAWPATTSTGSVARGEVIQVSVPAPSPRFARFAHPSGFFSIQYPNNWRPYAASGTLAVTLAPPGGVVEATDGVPVMAYGVIINHYVPFEGETSRRARSLQRNYAPFEDRSGPRGTLEDATDDLIYQVLTANPYLSAQAGSAQRVEIDGARGYTVLLSGRSPATGEDERVTAYTRALPDGHVLYALCIAPSREWATLDRTCTRMLTTLLVNDESAHRTSGTQRLR